jgi:hypothetical protein
MIAKSSAISIAATDERERICSLNVPSLAAIVFSSL